MPDTTSTTSSAVAVTLYLDPATKHRIDSLRPLGYTLNGFIRAALAEHLKRHAAAITDPESLSRLVSHS